MDYPEPVIHQTGHQPVTVATFQGTHEYVPFDIRPWPERMETEIRRLQREMATLREEVASLQARQQWHDLHG